MATVSPRGTTPAPSAASILMELLRNPSPTGAVDAAADALCSLLRECGFDDVHRDEAGSVVGTWGSGQNEAMLLGHLDTVPGLIPVRNESGRISGRGAVDAKGSLAAAIAAVTRQRRDGACRFTVVAVPDEEGPSHGARLLASRGAPAHLVILEPSGWDAVTVGYRGTVLMGFQVTQEMQHGSSPDPSAGDRAVAFAARLRAWADERNDGRTGFEGVSVRILAMNASGDGLHESATMRIGLRLPTHTSPAELRTFLQTDPESDAVTVDWSCSAVRCSKSSRAARGLLEGIRRHGGVPRFKVKTGTSDMNVVVPAWGCDAVAYGPGDSHLDHSPREAIDIEELERGAAILAVALSRL